MGEALNWYAVWTAIVDAVEQDEEIGVVLGRGEACAFFLAGEREVQVPSLTALLVVDFETETEAPAEWQLDLYTKTLEDANEVETALRRLFNQPLSTDLAGVTFRAEFMTGTFGPRGPERDPYFHRQLEFRFTPVRSRYYRPQPVGE